MLRFCSRIGLIALMLGAVIRTVSAGPLQIVPQPKNPDKVGNYPTTGIIDPRIVYTAGGKQWATTTIPVDFLSASMLAAQGNENPYVQALNNFGMGWSFNFASGLTLADKSLLVHTDQAQGPTPPASNSLAFRLGADAGNMGDTTCVKNNNCTGAEFYVRYNPTGTDPTNNVHWIQVIYDGSDFGVDIGTVITMVDGKPKVVPIPYYDDGEHTANDRAFVDFPFTRDVTTPSVFDATLFLVSGPPAEMPGLVTIYGAITWGWSNNPIPEPPSVALFGGGLVLLWTVAARRPRRLPPH